jgi:uncharacterized membrane protein
MMVQMRKWFIAGLLVWIPLAITIFVVNLLMDWLDASLLLIPRPWRPANLLGFEIPGLGLILSLLLVLGTGALAANYFGNRFIKWAESVLNRIPVVRSVYSAFKKMTETVLSNTSTAFRKVVLIEYPRRGLWQIAFITGDPVGEVQDKTDKDVISVFVPTTPNPTSGWIVMIPKADVIELEMSVEEGMKFVISLGVVPPVRRVRPPVAPPSTPAT